MKSLSHVANTSGTTGSASGRSRRGKGGLAGSVPRASLTGAAAGLPAVIPLPGGYMRSASSVLAPDRSGVSGTLIDRSGRSRTQPQASSPAIQVATGAPVRFEGVRLPPPQNRAEWLEMVQAFNAIQASRGLNLEIAIPAEAFVNSSGQDSIPDSAPGAMGLQREAWWRGRAGQVLNKPKARVFASPPELDAQSEREVEQTYDKIISLCLGLSNRALSTPWNKLNPYENSDCCSTGPVKTRYLNSMLGKNAFSAAAEFQIFVNQVNTHVLNIRDPRLFKKLLGISGAEEGVTNNSNLPLTGRQVKNDMWWVTAKYCLDYFRKAARQHSALPERAKTPADRGYNFELLMQLQTFNVRFSVLERDTDSVNFDTGLLSQQRLEKLVTLRQRALDLQEEAGRLYHLCNVQRLPSDRAAFILGDPVPIDHTGRLTSKKIARFIRDVSRAIARAE